MEQNCISVPLEALVPGGDSSNAAKRPTPAVGDVVDITATGKVTSLEGDTALVKLETVNGLPLAGSPAPEAEVDDAGMRHLAQAADDETWSD